MKLNVFKSYGVLAHEKEPMFTVYGPASEFYDIVTVQIPDKYPISENDMGDYLITLDDVTYLLQEVLSNSGIHPVLRWYDGRSYRTVYLDK